MRTHTQSTMRRESSQIDIRVYIGYNLSGGERRTQMLVVKAIIIKKFFRFDDPLLVTNDIIKMWFGYPFALLKGIK